VRDLHAVGAVQWKAISADQLVDQLYIGGSELVVKSVL